MINIFEDENLRKQYSTVDTNQSQKIIEDTINVWSLPTGDQLD